MVQQIAKPISDISNPGNWVDLTWGDNDGALWDELDEVTIDNLTSAINRKTPSSATDFFEIRVQVLSTPFDRNNHKIKFWASAPPLSKSYYIKALLLEGSTLRASSAPILLTPTIAAYEYTLTNAEASSIVDYTNLRVRIIPLYTIWDVSSAVFLQEKDISINTTVARDVFFRQDGLKMYVVGRDGGGNSTIYEYNLSTEWDVSTASLLQSKNIDGDGTSVQGVFFRDDGLKMYTVNDFNDDVNEYNLSTAWNVSTASFSQSKDVGAQDLAPTGVFFKPDGTKMYVIGNGNDSIYEYNLSTAWNISTASHLQTKSISAQDSSMSGLFFRADGLKMYAVGTTNNDVYEYDLSSAWNISTISHLQTKVLSSPNTEGIFFSPDGDKMYIADDGVITIDEYNIG